MDNPRRSNSRSPNWAVHSPDKPVFFFTIYKVSGREHTQHTAKLHCSRARRCIGRLSLKDIHHTISPSFVYAHTSTPPKDQIFYTGRCAQALTFTRKQHKPALITVQLCDGSTSDGAAVVGSHAAMSFGIIRTAH